MLGIPALDVAIGLSFVYLLLSLICTTLNEMLAGTRKTRAKFLDKGIDRLLGGDSELKRKFYRNAAIKTLAPSDAEICPSYIPAPRFATGLMDVLSGSGRPLTDLAAIRAAIPSVSPALGEQLTILLDKSGDVPDAFHKALEDWFSDTMDRVSGWYKVHSQRNATILAVAITLCVNADTVHIVQTLWTNPTLRQAVVEEARARAQKERPEDLLPVAEYSNPNDPTESTAVHVSESQTLSANEQNLLGQLTGWGPDWARWSAQDGQRNGLQRTASWTGTLLWIHLLGWILTAVAVSQGAPFWFDTLNRFMNIRNAGRPPDEPRGKTSPAPNPAPGGAR